MRRHAINLVMMAISLAMGYIIMEIGYRGYLYYSYAINAQYAVVTTDVRPVVTEFAQPGSLVGPYLPNTTTMFSFYNSDGRLVMRHPVHSNNLGWVSRYDYTEAPSPREFRVAVIGASLAASLNNAYPWPDVLQERLNADRELLEKLDVDRITVLNISVAGASLQFIAYPLSNIARHFSPNLAVVNFSTDNLEQRHYREMPSVRMALAERRADGPPAPHPEQRVLVVDGVEIPVMCTGTGETDPTDADCRVSPLWYVPREITLDQDRLNRIKRQAASLLIRNRVVLTLKPLLLLEVLGRPAIPRANAQERPELTVAGDPNSDFQVGLESLQFIRAIVPRLLIIHNPTYNHLTRVRLPSNKTQNEILTEFAGYVRPAGFEIVSMEDFLPVQQGEAEWRRWYNVPHDYHWSDFGAQLYGAAVANVIHQEILGRDAAATASVLYQQTRDQLAHGDNAGALAHLTAMLAEEPGNTHLLGLRSRTYSALGQDDAAEADLSTILDILTAADSTRPEILMQRAAIRAPRGDAAGAEADLTAAATLAPHNPQIYIARGNTRFSAGNLQAAIEDYEHALTLGPPTAALYFLIGQARGAAGDPAGAVDAINAAIAISPNNADLLYLRGYFHVTEGHLREAVDDFSAALAIKPDLVLAQEMQARTLRMLNATQ